MDLLGLRVWMATAEDRVISKLKTGRRSAQGAALDLVYIERWVHELGLEALWSQVRAPAEGQR